MMKMKLFISWSGALSEKLAEALKSWIPNSLQNVSPYFSPTDVEKGTKWDSEIASELEACNMGIFVLTRENLNSNWLLFEAGAISKQVGKSRVCPILFGIRPEDVTAPLSQFQLTSFSKSDFFKLFRAINNNQGEGKLADDNVEEVFSMWWPRLEETINEIMADYAQGASEPIRNDRDLLIEILEISRSLTRQPTAGEKVSEREVSDLLLAFARYYQSLTFVQPEYLNSMRFHILRRSCLRLADKIQDPSPSLIDLIRMVKTLNLVTVENDDVPF